MASNRIETLIERGNWKGAYTLIEKELTREPNDHWLWSRLSGVKYEQRDYQGALDAAEKALAIVPDCPLALWSYAGALDMLGSTREAGKVYTQVLRRGLDELKKPDEDADECWEGTDWTLAIVADSIFRTGDCLSKMRKRDKAIEWYLHFLSLLDCGIQGIYSREDAIARVKKLVPGKSVIPKAVMRRLVEDIEKVMG